MFKKLKFHEWGRMLCLLAAAEAASTGFVTYFYISVKDAPTYGIMCSAIGIIVGLIEYPCDGRNKEAWPTRFYTVYGGLIDSVFANFLFRAFVYFAFCIPLFLMTPTIIAGVTLLVGVGVYAQAGLNDEAPASQRKK